MGHLKKNPAYGRQRISRPMRIVEPLIILVGGKKKTKKTLVCQGSPKASHKTKTEKKVTILFSVR